MSKIWVGGVKGRRVRVGGGVREGEVGELVDKSTSSMSSSII
jgi:hypothetical protein